MEIFENAVNDYVTALDTSVNAHVLIKDGTVFSHFCVLLQMDKGREKKYLFYNYVQTGPESHQFNI